MVMKQPKPVWITLEQIASEQNGRYSCKSGNPGWRSLVNEKRAISLFEKLGETSDKNPLWENQTEHIMNIFRDFATYNNYLHPSGSYYGWDFSHNCIEYVKQN